MSAIIIASRCALSTAFSWERLHFEGCSRSQEKAIERAHRDAIMMAEMAKDINFANDPAAIDFSSTHSKRTANGK
jgi:hypothetical protein